MELLKAIGGIFLHPSHVTVPTVTLTLTKTAVQNQVLYRGTSINVNINVNVNALLTLTLAFHATTVHAPGVTRWPLASAVRTYWPRPEPRLSAGLPGGPWNCTPFVCATAR